MDGTDPAAPAQASGQGRRDGRGADDPLAALDTMIDDLTRSLRALVEEMDYTARELQKLQEVRARHRPMAWDGGATEAWRRGVAAHQRAAHEHERDAEEHAAAGRGSSAGMDGARADGDSPGQH